MTPPPGRCGPEGRHTIPDGPGPQSCPCGATTRHPAPTPKGHP